MIMARKKSQGLARYGSAIKGTGGSACPLGIALISPSVGNSHSLSFSITLLASSSCSTQYPHRCGLVSIVEVALCVYVR